MKREEVKTEYKWRLEDIFETDDDWEKEFASVEQNLNEPIGFKGKLKEASELLKCMHLVDELSLSVDRLYSYAHMRKDENGVSDFYVGLSDRAMGLNVRLSANLSFIEPELSSLSPKNLDALISDASLVPYRYFLKEIARNKEHILGEKEEKLLSQASESMSCFHNVFSMLDNVDLPLPKVKDENGKSIRLTQGKYSYLLSCKDAKVREDAFHGLYSAYKGLVNTIAATYAGSVKKDNFFTRARGFSSPLEMALFSGNIPSTVYENLLKYVGENLESVHKYVEYRKKAMGGELHMYDMYVSLIDGADLKVDYEEAFSMVLEALKPLGEEYTDLLKTAKNNRWIDVEETENKRSGAYQSGCYGVHPYVLLNYSSTSHDVFTIAHELGHAMHTYYSNKALSYSQSNYAIFVAEVASTVNEVLLLKHLISSTTDLKFKKFLLTYYLDMFRTTLFRQTMFAEFELKAHEMDMAGIPLTPGALCDMYYELNRKYYGESVIHDDDIRYEWARIPHFYTAFYVYKYATGLTSAVNIASGIIANPENVNNYKKFLSAGGSDSPYEILKIAGVDLASPQPYETAMKEFLSTLEELESLS